MHANPQNHVLYQTLWDHALLGVALVGREGHFMAANPAFCKWVEYTEAELKTKKYQEITHPDDVHFDQLMAGELLLGKIGGYDMPKRYLTKFGRVINMMSRVAAIYDQEGSAEERFVCFLSQMAPLCEQQISAAAIIPSTSAPRVSAARRLFWRQVLAHWPAIMFALGLIVSVIVQVVEKLS